MFFLVTQANMTVNEVLFLDILSFNAYVEAVLRAQALERISQVWAMHLASQAETKTVKKWAKNLEEQAGINNHQSTQERKKKDVQSLFKILKNKGK